MSACTNSASVNVTAHWFQQQAMSACNTLSSISKLTSGGDDASMQRMQRKTHTSRCSCVHLSEWCRSQDSLVSECRSHLDAGMQDSNHGLHAANRGSKPWFDPFMHTTHLLGEDHTKSQNKQHSMVRFAALLWWDATIQANTATSVLLCIG